MIEWAFYIDNVNFEKSVYPRHSTKPSYLSVSHITLVL